MVLKASISPITAGTLALLCLCPVSGGSLAAEAACRSDAPLALSLDGDLVSLTSEQACLEAILQELQRQAPVTIHSPPTLSQEGVTESFSGLPLAEALARILKRTNYLLWTKSPDDTSPARTAGVSGPVEVWITHRGSSPPAALDQEAVRAELLERARDILAADTEELMAQARDAPDPQLRANAVALLVHAEKDAAVAETILAALEDPDPRVREAALHIVADLGPEAPGAAATVAQMARRDESPELRMRALEKLFAANYRRDLAEATVLAALEDPEAEVRALAQNLLELVSPQGRGD
jgi:hypothetical protein